MNYIEQAIQKAYPDQKEMFGGSSFVNWQAYMLHPDFWVALGKSLGWHEGDKTQEYAGKRLYLYETIDDKYSWLGQQHRFIDHLASNGDPETFFKEILTQK